MPYCSNCGAQLTEDIKFCSQCGAEQNGQIPVQRISGVQKRLHCPKCKSTALTPITENIGSVGYAGPMTKNTAIVGTSAENRSFWMCQYCGHKFRNLEDLIEDHKKRILIMKIFTRVCCISFAIMICLIGLLSGKFVGTILFLLIPYLMHIFFERLIKKSRAEFDEKERKLRKACFE